MSTVQERIAKRKMQQKARRRDSFKGGFGWIQLEPYLWKTTLLGDDLFFYPGKGTIHWRGEIIKKRNPNQFIGEVLKNDRLRR